MHPELVPESYKAFLVGTYTDQPDPRMLNPTTGHIVGVFFALDADDAIEQAAEQVGQPAGFFAVEAVAREVRLMVAD